MDERLTLFQRFGGTRPMARALGKAAATVSRWKQERRVPSQHHALVLNRAAELGLDVSAEDVMFPFPEDRDVR